MEKCEIYSGIYFEMGLLGDDIKYLRVDWANKGGGKHIWEAKSRE
jgi:hypothetical protein